MEQEKKKVELSPGDYDCREENKGPKRSADDQETGTTYTQLQLQHQYSFQHFEIDYTKWYLTNYVDDGASYRCVVLTHEVTGRPLIVWLNRPGPVTGLNYEEYALYTYEMDPGRGHLQQLVPCDMARTMVPRLLQTAHEVYTKMGVIDDVDETDLERLELMDFVGLDWPDEAGDGDQEAALETRRIVQARRQKRAATEPVIYNREPDNPTLFIGEQGDDDEQERREPGEMDVDSK